MQFKLAPRWTFESHNSSAVIWKLLISPSGILVGEERNVEQKTASLFAVNVMNGSVLWRNVVIEEPWWFAIEKATDDTLYIQTFRTPELPEPQGIIALDIHSGHERWKQPELCFASLGSKTVYAMRQGFSRKEFFALNIHSGKIVEEFGEDGTVTALARDASGELDPNSYYAHSLGNERENFHRKTVLLEGIVREEDIRGPIDILEFGEYLIFSYHARVHNSPEAMLQNLLSSELIVVDKNTGDLLFRETLHRETPFPLPDNFFVTHHTLIYVKEKRTIVGVPLP